MRQMRPFPRNHHPHTERPLWPRAKKSRCPIPGQRFALACRVSLTHTLCVGQVTDKQKVAARWSDSAVVFDAFSPQLYWLAVPAVQARHQRRSCGGRNYPSWVEYCLNEFMPGAPAQRMLSIGCGHGALERQLHALGAFEACDAFDIAPGAIEMARKAASAAGIHTIKYESRDVEALDFADNLYDAIWFNGSLHHIAALEVVLQNVRKALKPSGLLFLHEYVGADRFALPQAQREAIERAFLLIPETYRKSFAAHDFGEIAARPQLPDPEEVRRADPSEAVRSSAILPVLNTLFDTLALNTSGGTLLQFLMSGIAGNFRAEDPKSMAVLDMLCRIEDTLIETGHLPSDFVVCVARAKPQLADLDAPLPDLQGIQTAIDGLRQHTADASDDLDRLRKSLARRT